MKIVAKREKHMTVVVQVQARMSKGSGKYHYLGTSSFSLMPERGEKVSVDKIRDRILALLSQHGFGK